MEWPFRFMMDFRPLNEFAPVENYRQNLPHWRQGNVTYYTTWRLADSLPQSKLAELRAERAEWFRAHEIRTKEDVEQLPEVQRHEYHTLFTSKVHEWLDAGMGACQLRDPRCAKIVAEALQHFDGSRYVLDAFVVMPNHVHALVRPMSGWRLEQIMHSWKSFTAKSINRTLGREGPFWLEETWDHIVHGVSQLEHYRCYIRENPAKAGLREGEFIVGCGSGLRTGWE